MLVHVPQRCPFDCVVASAAMVANVTYEEALAHCPVKPWERGLSPQATLRLLKGLTGIAWQDPRFGWFRRVCSLPAQEQGQLAFVCTRLSLRATHCIALQGEWVHDPELPRGFRARHYPRRRRRVFLVFRPATPASLAEVRRDNWPARHASLELGGEHPGYPGAAAGRPRG